MARAYVVVLEKSLLLDRARSWDKTQAPNVQYASRYPLGGGAAREMAEPRRGSNCRLLGLNHHPRPTCASYGRTFLSRRRIPKGIRRYSQRLFPTILYGIACEPFPRKFCKYSGPYEHSIQMPANARLVRRKPAGRMWRIDNLSSVAPIEYSP